ncbi:MAG TPA: hypothetical protein VIH92_07695 [Solirubrobacteraceae bacterium]
MPDAALANQLTVEAERLLNATSHNYIDGDDVARAVGRDPQDADVYLAFREVQRRDSLKLDAWGGGMGLPHIVGPP